MEVIKVPEGHFVRSASGGGNDVKVIELVGSSTGGGVNDSLAVNGDMGTGSVKRLLGQDRYGFFDSILFDGHAPQMAGAQRNGAVGKKDDLFAIGSPRRFHMEVPEGEIQPVADVAIVFGESD